MQQLIWREKQEFAWPGMTKPKKKQKNATNIKFAKLQPLKTYTRYILSYKTPKISYDNFIVS